MFHIEPMQKQHINEVVALSKQVFLATSWSKEQFEQELPNSFVCMHENKVVGFVCLLFSVDDMTILNIATHPNFLRKGIATLLMQTAFDEAKKRQIEQFFLEVETHNEPAKAFYEKLGFEITRERKDYYPDHTNCYEMSKKSAL